MIAALRPAKAMIRERGGVFLLIPVVLKGGHAELVSKDELQYLLATEKIAYFKRSDGWAVLGRDQMRHEILPFDGKDRREHQVFARH